MDGENHTSVTKQGVPLPWLAPGFSIEDQAWIHSGVKDQPFLKSIEPMIDSMGQDLEELSSQSQGLAGSFSELESSIHSNLTVLRNLTTSYQFQYAFHVVDFQATPLYVKRRFDLTFKVVTTSHHSLLDIYPLYCNLSVQEMTSRGDEITQTRNGIVYIGNSLLKGELTKAFLRNTTMRFNDLTFYDITGKYPQGRVNLVVKCVNKNDIQPLMVEGVRVKARKKHPDEVF